MPGTIPISLEKARRLRPDDFRAADHFLSELREKLYAAICRGEPWRVTSGTVAYTSGGEDGFQVITGLGAKVSLAVIGELPGGPLGAKNPIEALLETLKGKG